MKLDERFSQAQANEAENRLQLARDFVDTFTASPVAERVLKHIVEKICGIYEPTRDVNPNAVLERAGRRNVAIEIKALLELNFQQKTPVVKRRPNQ